jgi:hypothetical protein
MISEDLAANPDGLSAAQRKDNGNQMQPSATPLPVAVP